MTQPIMRATEAIAAFGAGTLAADSRIVDSPAAIVAAMDALRPLALSGKLAGIDLRDGGLNVVAVTVAQREAGAEVLALLSPNAQLSQAIGAADAADAVLDPHFASFTIGDSLAGVLANLAGVSALMRGGRVAALRLSDTGATLSLSAAELASMAQVLGQVAGPARTITLSDAGVPHIVLSADALADPAVRGAVLGRIAGPYVLQVTGTIGVATALAILAENGAALARLAGVRIADFAAAVTGNIAPLKTLADAGKLSGIDLLDGGVPALGLTTAVVVNNGSVLGLIASPHVNGNAATSAGRMSAATFMGMLSNLEYSAQHGTMAKVTLSNLTTPVMSVTAADLAANLEAFGKLDNPNVPAAPYAITLTDGGSPGVALANWQVSAAAVAVLGRVSSAYSLSIAGSLSASAAALLVAGGLAGKLSGTLAVTDTSANVAAHLAALQTLAGQGRIGGIALLDGGRPLLALSPAQVAAAPAALAAIVSPYVLTRNTTAIAASPPGGAFAAATVTDSAANIQANLAALEPLAVDGRLAGITVTGGGAFALSLTAAELGANADALLRITNSFTIGLIGAGTPSVTLQHWQVGGGIGALLDRVTTPYALEVSGPLTAADASLLAGAAAAGRMGAGGLSIRDTPTGLVARIGAVSALAAVGAVAAIDLGGGTPVLSLAAADGPAATALTPLITTPVLLSQVITVADIGIAVLAAGFSSFTVADSTANVLAGLAQIQGLAAGGLLGRLQFTDPAPSLVVSPATIAATVQSWAVQDGGAYPITLSGSNPVLTLPAAVLGGAVFRGNIVDAIVNPSWSLVATGAVSVAVAAAIAGDGGATVGHLAGGVRVTATAAELVTSLAPLGALAARNGLAAIDVTGGGALVLSVSDAQAAEYGAVLARVSGSYRLVTPSGVTAQESLGSLSTVNFSDFGPGSAIALRDLAFAPGGVSFSYAGTSLQVLKNGVALGTATVAPPAGGAYTAGSFYLAADGAGGTLVRASAAPISVTDTRTSSSTVTGGDFYAGAVGYLQRQFINASGDPVSVAAGIPNVFLHGGGAVGGNALQVLGGQNVLDGGVGSNFLVGGTDSAGADTFFLDGRGGGVSWGTVVNFHQGDAVTFWGWKDGVTNFDWVANDGAPGFSGATIHARLGGGSGAYDASITFAGVDLATAQGFAFIGNGAVGGTSYAYIASL